ncbi:helix-turn-helix transcriptional regulator [Embleya hyalina]|uniref:Putative HTH-type transcriptional regulator n=1 Tax=Embleya hyalina TaxID=516124 RepID=A0A401YQQ0_9ACTN|nr:LuxR C-terminal-related transcriptional regulator [Embleya hyalina]GCD96922.1 putative HTH-type transcriptional regulator [Embleya hyalina]
MSTDRPARVARPRSEPPTSFVGRRHELAELKRLFESGRRLVTLIGPGGIGKTRLAEHAATAFEADIDRVTFVDLVTVTDPCSVAAAILDASAVAASAGSSPLLAVAEAFADRHGLLVLDGCEHLSADVAAVVDVLVSRCPRLRLLITSREPLGLPGETVLVVPPLAVDPSGVDGRGDRGDAARLFIDRILSGKPRQHLTSTESHMVDDVVRELDGIPLAIELVAAYAKTTALADIHASVHRWRLSADDPTRQERHRTMRRSLDWSHALLSHDEALLLARLSVFAGGWTLEAAERVCADAALAEPAILDALTGLLDKSLITLRHGVSSVRFDLLGVVREYAAELLADPDRAEVVARHRRYFLALAEHTDVPGESHDPARHERLDVEAANLRAALDEACRRGSADALRITAALALHWRIRGRFAEGANASAQALEAVPETASGARARALATHATLVFWTGDLTRAKLSALEAIEVARVVGDRRAHAHGLARHATAVTMAHPRDAQPALRQAVRLAREVDDPVALCDALSGLAMSYHWQDDFPRMIEAIQRNDEVAASIGLDSARFWTAWALTHRARLTEGPRAAWARAAEMAALVNRDDALVRGVATEVRAIIDVMAGHPARGYAIADAQAARSRREALRWGTGMLRHAMGLAKVALGDFDAARDLGEGLYAREQNGAGYLAWHAQEILMLAALGSGDPGAGRVHAERIVAIADHLGNRRADTVARAGLARAALLERDLVDADARAQEALAACVRHGWWVDALGIVEIVAAVAVERGQPDRAIRLFAGVGAARAQRGLVRFRSEDPFWQSRLDAARAAVDPPARARAEAAGASRSLEQTLEYASRGRGSRKPRGRGWTGLTRMERQVAELAAQGLPNAAIAAELFIAMGTVKNHLAHIFGKLEITNRTELAARRDHLNRVSS